MLKRNPNVEVIVGDAISLVIIKGGITDENLRTLDHLQHYLKDTVFDYIGEVSRYSLHSDMMFMFFNVIDYEN